MAAKQRKAEYSPFDYSQHHSNDKRLVNATQNRKYRNLYILSVSRLPSVAHSSLSIMHFHCRARAQRTSSALRASWPAQNKNKKKTKNPSKRVIGFRVRPLNDTNSSLFVEFYWLSTPNSIIQQTASVPMNGRRSERKKDPAYSITTARAILFVSCRCDCRCQHRITDNSDQTKSSMRVRPADRERVSARREYIVRKCYLLTTPLHSLNSFSLIISFHDCHAIGFRIRRGAVARHAAITTHSVRFNLIQCLESNVMASPEKIKSTHHFNIDINLDFWFSLAMKSARLTCRDKQRI